VLAFYANSEEVIVRLSMVILSASVLLATAALGQVTVMGLTMRADVTGDGVDDEIKAGRSVVVEDGMSSAKYVVLRSDDVSESTTVNAYAVDLDKTPPSELVVELLNPSGSATASIYSLKGGAVQSIGTLPGSSVSRSDLSDIIWFRGAKNWGDGNKMAYWMYPATWTGAKWTPMRSVSADENVAVVTSGTKKSYSYSCLAGEALSYRVSLTRGADVGLRVDKTEKITVPPSGAVKDTVQVPRESEVERLVIETGQGHSMGLVMAFPTEVKLTLNNSYSIITDKTAAVRVERYSR
jgi:hypothetical protein